MAREVILRAEDENTIPVSARHHGVDTPDWIVENAGNGTDLGVWLLGAG